MDAAASPLVTFADIRANNKASHAAKVPPEAATGGHHRKPEDGATAAPEKHEHPASGSTANAEEKHEERHAHEHHAHERLPNHAYSPPAPAPLAPAADSAQGDKPGFLSWLMHGTSPPPAAAADAQAPPASGTERARLGLAIVSQKPKFHSLLPLLLSLSHNALDAGRLPVTVLTSSPEEATAMEAQLKITSLAMKEVRPVAFAAAAAAVGAGSWPAEEDGAPLEVRKAVAVRYALTMHAGADSVVCLTDDAYLWKRVDMTAFLTGAGYGLWYAEELDGKALKGKLAGVPYYPNKALRMRNLCSIQAWVLGEKATNSKGEVLADFWSANVKVTPGWTDGRAWGSWERAMPERELMPAIDPSLVDGGILVFNVDVFDRYWKTVLAGSPADGFLASLHAALSLRAESEASCSKNAHWPGYDAYDLDSSFFSFSFHNHLFGSVEVQDSTAALKKELQNIAGSLARLMAEANARKSAEVDAGVSAFYQQHPQLTFMLELPEAKPEADDPCQALKLAASIPAPSAALQLGHKGPLGVPEWAVVACAGLFK